MENSRRQSLRSRASLNSLEREAQLEKKPKTQPKSLQPRIDALQSFPLRRSMSKKVEEFLQWLQTPRQPARHSNRVPTPLSALKIQEVSSEKSPRGSPVSVTQDSPAIDWKDFTRKRLFQGGNYGGNSKPKELEQLSKVQPGETVITESEEMKVTEKRTLRKSQPDRKSPKTPQSRDRFGRWLPKVLSGKGPPGKDQRDRNPKGEQDGNVKCKANKERSSVKQTEEPGTELKKVKEQQNCIQRRSLRLANLYSSKEKACSLDHIEQCHLECNDINTEESMNTGCEPDVADSSETQQVPDHRSSVEEGLETTKVVQAIMKEANEESEILERLPCDTSSLSEPACLSVKDTCGSLAQSNSDSVQKQDFGIMTPRADLVDKEVQTVTPEPFILAAEELKTEDLKMQAEMFVEDPSPEESQSDVVKESPPFKQALQNLRNGMEFGALKIEEETSAEGQIMGERTRWEVTRRKPESDEAKISEASEKVRGANGQAEAVAANLHQDAEAQYVEKNKETPKSALQLIVSNLDSSKNFADLQIAIITFFKERKLLITSIGVKKSRKRGFVTFQSGKDTSRALKYNGEDLLGHALRIRRPPQIPKPVAIVKGRKRKLKDADGEASILCPAKKSNIQKTTALTKKNKQEPVSLIKRRKKKRKQISSSEAASTEPSGEVVEGTTEASLRQLKKRKRRISTAALSAESKGDKLEDKLLTKEKKKSTAKAAFCEGTEGNAASLPQKKKKKKSQQQEVFLSDKQAEGEKEEEEKVASVLQKKKKKSNEKLALSEKPMVEEHAACAEKTKRKKTQEKTSWCLYIQKLRSQNTPYELKTAIGDFLSERSVPFKEIQLDPDSCSARVELNREGDLNEAVRLDTCKILGQTAKLSKVEKLGALDGRIDTRTLHVKTLPSEVCAKDLKRLFERVAGVWICQNVDKRFAFVVFETEEDSANALSSGEIECRGNLLRLQRACLTKQKKRKILMVKNLPYPISKKYLKSIFNDAEDVHMSKGSQSQGTAYVEYKTAKQAKTALKDFRSRGVPGQAVRVSLIEEGQESPGCQSDGSDSTRSLFIWGLSNQTTVETLKSTFKEAVDARIPRKTGKRFAFVDFKTAEAARRARAEFQDVEIDGRQIKLYFTNSTQ
ncbi:uncharacterized protein LOC125448823 isoform X4 [Stegostoma tigrinum]|uniref:uncharacterized protein LOC125448823 isoform X4 n=1 Tax=Stegostoma tigrinum TaxID=3053191 RepID=UPI0028709F41|nr:uncharacterized protein LOC125448823 isoform X4 [Stegostoma tigrinum]